MSQDESPDNSPSGLNIDEDHVSEGEGHGTMMDSSPRFEENDPHPQVSPKSEAILSPDTESTAVPDTESTAVPDTVSTAVSDTGSTAVPDTGSTAVPDTVSTTVPDTKSTTVPVTGSTVAPEIESTELPDTGSSAVPDTDTTAEIPPVELSSDASNSDGNANANVLEETNEMEIDNIDDDAVAKEPEKMAESCEQNGTEGKGLCEEKSPSSPASIEEPCETADESEKVTCHSDAPASPTDDSEQVAEPVTVSLDSEIMQESSKNADLHADVSLSSALDEESNASYDPSINTEEAQNVDDDDDKDDDNQMDTNQSDTGNEKKKGEVASKPAAPPTDDDEAIDLEDGELPESDEEEDQAPKSKDKTASEVVAELQAKVKSSIDKDKEKSSKEKQKEKEKEREKRKKEKDEKKREKEKKKRRHSDEENKSSKSKRKKEEEATVGNEGEYFYARGPSPDNPSFGNGDEAESRPDQNEGEEFERRSRDHRGRRRDERPAPPTNRGGRNQPDNARKNEAKPPKTDLICLYYMQGKCQKSADDCNFSHDAVPPRKMELCKFWMMECCAKKEKCLYLHNDFPCKFYHTGLICKLGEKCKFSHQPLNEQTKAVLLKHIETAPKEILGDFPRLNRAGALNLINKMENKINMQMNGGGNGGERERDYRDDSGPNHQKFGHHNSPHSHSSMDSHQDRNQRRTRWEQPTRDDQEKLHELMEEAGIGNLYKEATEPENELPQKPPSQPILPTPTPLLANPALSNPALGNVLASLNIPTNALSASQNPVNPFVPDPQFFHSLQILSAATGGPNGPTPQQIHQATQAIQQQLQNFQQSQLQQQVTLPNSVGVPPSSAVGTSVPNPSITSSSQIANDDMMSPPSPNKPTLETLPKMQREIFKRIQNMQKKKEQENSGGESEIRMDDDWYSSEDEDQDRGPIGHSGVNQRKIPQTTTVPCVPPATTTTTMPLKDVDLRSMPFGDTDFRLPPLRSGTSFQDIDLRTGDPSGFKKIPETPATEIDAGISTHSGISWKVVEVAGIRRIDYSYVRGSVQSNQILNDPRLVSLRSGGGSSVPIGPESPPPSSAMDSPNIFGISSPARDFSDPRTRKNQRESGGGRSGLGAPDGPPQQQQQQQPLLQTPQLNPPFFAPTDLSPAAFAQLMQSAAASNPVAASALLPNVPHGSFVTQDFMNIAAAAAQAAAVALQQQQQQTPGQQMMSRPPFHQPKSSWESRYQQGSGGVTPPL